MTKICLIQQLIANTFQKFFENFNRYCICPKYLIDDAKHFVG